VTVHDLAFLDHPEHVTRHGRRFFNRSLALTHRDADLVLCPSQSTERELHAAGVDAGRIRVVPWGVTPTAVSEAAVDAVRHRYDTGSRYVLWVGTVEPRKNLTALSAAFRRLADTDVRLVLVGPQGWNETLGAHLAGLQDRVRVLGFVPVADLRALYTAAAVFCYPSWREGFGLPVLEAMAAGAPVVTASGTATEEVAGDAGVCVDPRDDVALAAALDRVLGDPVYATELATRGRARANSFTWARTAELTAAAYHEVAR
jgi:glycosyltransferase involved in cell wall biosynthesis